MSAYLEGAVYVLQRPGSGLFYRGTASDGHRDEITTDRYRAKAWKTHDGAERGRGFTTHPTLYQIVQVFR